MKAYLSAIVIGLILSITPLLNAEQDYGSPQGPMPTKPGGQTSKGPSPLSEQEQMAIVQKMGLSDRQNATDSQKMDLESEEPEGLE